MKTFQLNSPFVEQAVFNLDRVSGTKPDDDQHRHNCYELCQGINLTRLGVILEEMVNKDKLHPQLANIFKTQASALLASMLSENNRIHDL